jgi:hypothetical protein
MKTSVIRHCRAAATSFVLAAAAFAAATGCGTRPATSCATVAVTRVKPARDGIPGGPGTFDPVFLRSQFDVIRSRPVLSDVVRSNGLGAVLDAAYGWKSACPDAAADRAVAYLQERTNLFIWKDTDLIGIEVSVDRKVPDAEVLSRKLASDIARAYRAYENALREKEIEAAAAELRAEIDSLGQQIEASAPGARSDLEWRRAALLERLQLPETLVRSYVDVRIISDPRLEAGGGSGEAQPPPVEARAGAVESDTTLDIPFYYEWANPGTTEEMSKALEPVERKLDGLDRLVLHSCTVNSSGRADFRAVFSTTGGVEAREILRILYEALDEVPVPDGAVLRVPVLVKGVKTPGTTLSPAEETHAESAENAEPEPHAEPADGAEGLEGRAPSRPEEGSGEAEPSPSVAPPPAP